MVNRVIRKISRRRLVNKSFIICHLLFSAALFASCSLMKEDRSDCPDCRNPLRIILRYDYNTMRANMFPDHVQEATVYVVDPETNTVIDFQTSRNTVESKPLREPSFGFNFEGLPGGQYRLFASARSAADATITVPELGIAESIGSLTYSLPSSQPSQRLDTVWNTLQPVDIILPEQEPVETTVRLMRLTNDLNVMVFRRDNPTDNGHERYENATSATRSTVAERNAHYDFSLFRLINNSDSRHNPRLIIRNRETGHDIVNIDLSYYLSLARNAYEIQNYSPQEYLDREYDYRLDFGIEGSGPDETWKYMTISINVLSWAIRIQNEDL